MATKDPQREIISVDSRPVRRLGNGSFGQSLDIDALRRLGHVNEDGELREDVDAVQKIFDDGSVKIELPPAGD